MEAYHSSFNLPISHRLRFLFFVVFFFLVIFCFIKNQYVTLEIVSITRLGIRYTYHVFPRFAFFKTKFPLNETIYLQELHSPY